MTETAPSTDVRAASAAALSAAPVVAASTAAERASWLAAVADALDGATDELVGIADDETHLGATRLAGEVARTTGQLRLFADVVTEGSYLEATIDHADTTATPPRPDLRRVLVPLGPVGVFAASNFPFAFSVAGGDTASALAAGNPVVVKAHPAHPRLSRRTAEIARGALAGAGAPEGTFGLVQGHDAGVALVTDAAIRAVGFTGSTRGGRALFDLAVGRADPIPFYGELGSINPVVVTADAVRTRGAELAAGLAASFTLGVGQFCTNPGLVLVPAGTGFPELVADAASGAAGGLMLTHRMAEAYASGVETQAAVPGVRRLLGPAAGSSGAHADSAAGSATDTAAPVVHVTSAAVVLDHPELLDEVFGPSTLLVTYEGDADLLAVLQRVGGALTATLHAASDEDVSALVPHLIALAGRVLFAGWPTGVAVTWSQQHGGPWPATTASLFTSVGATAIRRFLRPVAFQDAPAAALPPALREENPLGIPRRVDGVPTVGEAGRSAL
ncbi:Aldehyde Dehydrogenase [Beutenbergia cavernae DSM 12333]|uniref:Aldehyde Dehydrogenase n=1 Tax=Beutenbergia cavernae (strain ATCC BAA-8 / DSM 12333 / CCUG 43141 / JCM 11478 / NBRC 16432 / NCIMB 13614 / HKI 0122) TaxID=471853 RepID=C5BYT9_BEUC1|nr:aldehyde dehydrogenase (NADP(+)) [Beutenbergia cavernae]ACQ79047.1 Aldehyde Dehydrogenase [Beutenbergia cavernae DSM 12333]